MKTGVSVIISLVFVLTLIGCTNRSNVITDNNIELTDDEAIILSDTYNLSEDDFDNLLEYQVSGLNQLRAGLSYFDEKYPGYSLSVISFTPANTFNNWAEIIIRPDGYSDSCQINVNVTDNGYECYDNFYGELLHKEYDFYIEDVLRNSGFNCKCYTTFTEFCGLEIGLDTQLSELTDPNNKITKITYIFSDSGFEAVENIKEAINLNGVYGTYTIYFGCSLGLDIKDLVENRAAYEYETFSIFNN